MISSFGLATSWLDHQYLLGSSIILGFTKIIYLSIFFIKLLIIFRSNQVDGVFFFFVLGEGGKKVVRVESVILINCAR